MQTTIATRTPCVARVAPSQPATRMCSSVNSISSARVFANAPVKMTGPISARPATIVAARRDDRGENDGFQYDFALAKFHPHAPPRPRRPGPRARRAPPAHARRLDTSRATLFTVTGIGLSRSVVSPRSSREESSFASGPWLLLETRTEPSAWDVRPPRRSSWPCRRLPLMPSATS